MTRIRAVNADSMRKQSGFVFLFFSRGFSRFFKLWGKPGCISAPRRCPLLIHRRLSSGQWQVFLQSLSSHEKKQRANSKASDHFGLIWRSSILDLQCLYFQSQKYSDSPISTLSYQTSYVFLAMLAAFLQGSQSIVQSTTSPQLN